MKTGKIIAAAIVGGALVWNTPEREPINQQRNVKSIESVTDKNKQVVGSIIEYKNGTRILKVHIKQEESHCKENYIERIDSLKKQDSSLPPIHSVQQQKK